jgi:hypothetical protein
MNIEDSPFVKGVAYTAVFFALLVFVALCVWLIRILLGACV